MSLEIGPGITFGPGVRYDPIPVVVTAGLQLYLDAQSYVGMGDVWTSNLGSDATLEGSPLSTYTAASPTYFNFDPANGQYATVPGLGDLSSWTVEAWFRTTADLSAYGSNGLTSVVTTVYKEPAQPETNNINFCLTNYNGSTAINGIQVGFYNGVPGGGWHLTSPLTPTVGTWYQVVGTYDGTYLKQYNNSVYSSVITVGQTSQANGGNIRIARRWDGETNDAQWLFPGDISIIRIYNTALTAEQVTQNFAATKGRFGL